MNFIDPLEQQLPLLDKIFKEFEPRTAPQAMENLSKMLSESDGFLIVTGVYNHSLPPALKNLLDHFQREYYFKPSVIASYSSGSFGGVRAAVHLRAVLGELGMPANSLMFPFPIVSELFDSNLNPKNERIEKSTSRFIDEFIWLVEAFENQRNKGVPY